MSAFDSVVSEAAQAEDKAKAFAARVASFLPTAVPARVEVVAASASRIRSFATPLLVVAVIVGAYRYGGTEARADLEAYRASAAQALAAEKDRESMATVAIRDAADRRQGEANARATELQSRIDSYVADLRTRPVDARCTLDDADLRRLREVGASPRHGRRAPRPAAPTE